VLDFAAGIKALGFYCWITLALIVADVVLFQTTEKAEVMIKNMAKMFANRSAEIGAVKLVVLSITEVVEDDLARFERLNVMVDDVSNGQGLPR